MSVGHIGRRQFLRGAGAALIAAPFLDLLDPRRQRALAAPTKIADRLIIFFSPNGTHPQFWGPVATPDAVASYTFAPGSILEPLSSLRADLVVCGGIDFIGVDNHEPGMRNMLTGGGDVTSVGAGMSVDQYIGSQVGASTRFSSLEFGVQTSAWGGNSQTRMSYAAPGVFVTPEDDPVSAWKRLFGGVAMAGGGVDKLLARRKSVLDLVRGELSDLRARVGSVEKPKLDAHLDALRRTEQGLTGGGGVGCTQPTSPAIPDAYANAGFPSVGKAQMDLLVTALACGQTKVASLQWSHTVGPPVLAWDPVGATEGHHDLSHKDDSDAAGSATFVRCERWFAGQFAYLLQALKAAPDPVRGGTMLDSSLVMWCKELGDSRLHVCKSVPFVLAGGGNGYLKTGQSINFGGAAHQKLLTSLCQGMGLKNDRFGDASKGTGVLAGIS